MRIKKISRSRLARIAAVLVIVVIVSFFFRGWLYRQLVSYKTLASRATYSAADKDFASFIDSNIKNNPATIEEIILLSQKITSEHLEYTFSSCDIDPNALLSTKSTHCVGYAAFFTATCNYLLKKYSMHKHWRATSFRGQLYLMGRNVHNYFDDPFFRDHDFVIIENTTTGKRYAIDPTVYDYLWINQVSMY